MWRFGKTNENTDIYGKNLAPTNQELAIRSVVMGSHELEVGKLLELFYKANGIPYECSSRKTD